MGLSSYFNKRNTSWQEQISTDKLTEEQFTKLYRQALQERMPDLQIEITESLELTINQEEKQYICWLGNAWDECKNQPNIRVDTCTYYIDSFLRTLDDDLSKTESIDVNQIVLEIKCKEYLNNIPLQADGSHPIYSKLIAGDIYLTYALRLDCQICFLSASELEEAGLLDENLYNLALNNMMKIANDIRLYGKSPLFTVTSEGISASSLLLVDGIWEKQKPSIDGDIVACVPSKDFLLYTGSNEPNGILKLVEEAKEITKDDPYLISETLLVRKNGTWEVFEK